MNDDLIIQKFITDKNKINSHYKQIINKNQEIKEYLDNRYKDGNNDYCETLYRILDGMMVGMQSVISGVNVNTL